MLDGVEPRQLGRCVGHHNHAVDVLVIAEAQSEKRGVSLAHRHWTTFRSQIPNLTKLLNRMFLRGFMHLPLAHVLVIVGLSLQRLDSLDEEHRGRLVVLRPLLEVVAFVRIVDYLGNLEKIQLSL